MEEHAGFGEDVRDLLPLEGDGVALDDEVVGGGRAGLEAGQLVGLGGARILVQLVHLVLHLLLALLSQDVVRRPRLEQHHQQQDYLDGKVDIFLLLDLVFPLFFGGSFGIRWNAQTHDYEYQFKESGNDEKRQIRFGIDIKRFLVRIHLVFLKDVTFNRRLIL